MPPANLRASRLRAAVLATALLAMAAVAADPDREYLRGVKAFEGHAWNEAVPALRAAIAADRREGVRKLRVTGIVFEDYFPWAYLGLSLEKLGEREEARGALEESEKQGAVRSTGALEREVAATLFRLRVLPPPTATAPPAPSPTTPPGTLRGGERPPRPRVGALRPRAPLSLLPARG